MSMYVCCAEVDLGLLTKAEKTWLQDVDRIFDEEPWLEANHAYNSACVLVDINTKKAVFELGSVGRIVSSLDDICDDGMTNFGFSFGPLGPLDKGGYIYSDAESPNIDALARLLHHFIRKFRPTRKIGFTWGWIEGSKGGGGAVLITYRGIEVLNTSQWLEKKMKPGKAHKG